MEIISVINQKGGVGKSTTASAIGNALIKKGYSVLFIDLDAQGNLSSTFPIEINTNKNSYSILTEQCSILDAIQHSNQGDIVPYSPSLSAMDIVMSTVVGKEHKLEEAINSDNLNYDYIFIDTPPALGTLTVNALTASHSVIIPAQADYFSVQGISQLYSTICTIKKYCNPELKIKGIVLNRYNKRSTISRQIAEMLDTQSKDIETKLFKTKIRECTALKEAQTVKLSIFDYAPKSNAAADYKDLTDEIFGKEVNK